MVLRALIDRLRGGRAKTSRDAQQLALEFSVSPRTGAELLARFNAMGLRGVRAVALTRNRSVMVNLTDGTLRVHRAFLAASESVHRAIVRFLMSPRRAERIAARRVLITFPIGDDERRAPRAPERMHPDDEGMAAKLTEWHARYNTERFGGALKRVQVRVSRRMKARLGHYAPAQHGRPAEIAVSRRHLRRHSFAEGLETLLHEMVHQWQDEQGHPLGHDRRFREKAKAVGIAGRAKRIVD
ncbi:MAG: SprT-like domain-containing protein [Gemmatimonadaceae bacterium]